MRYDKTPECFNTILKQSNKKSFFNKIQHLATLTLDLRTKKYPVPLARQTSLQRSLGETPAYLGTHSTPSPEPSDTWADISLWARHCSSRNDRPEKERQRGQIYCLVSLTDIANIHTNVQGTSKPDVQTQAKQTSKKVFRTFLKLYVRYVFSKQISLTISIRAGLSVTGAILDPLALTVLAPVFRQRVVTGTK